MTPPLVSPKLNGGVRYQFLRWQDGKPFDPCIHFKKEITCITSLQNLIELDPRNESKRKQCIGDSMGNLLIGSFYGSSDHWKATYMVSSRWSPNIRSMERAITKTGDVAYNLDFGGGGLGAWDEVAQKVFSWGFLCIGTGRHKFGYKSSQGRVVTGTYNAYFICLLAIGTFHGSRQHW
jgi:hypothetical protein